MGGWEGEHDKPEPPKSGARAPNAVADDILSTNRMVTDASETTYRYEDGPWRELPKIMLHMMALSADGLRHTSQRRRGEIVSYIQAKSHNPDLSWGRVAAHELACRNGILDVRTFRMRPHHPAHYLESVLPWAWDVTVQCPAWLVFLEDCFEWAGAEGGEAAALQQFFGYIAMSHAKYKKALLLQGPPDTGKSVVEKIASRLVGETACCTLSVEDMDDPGRRSVIKGMALNTMTELPANAMIADSGFKTMVSTEDPILLDDKYKIRERYVPHAKHLIACNTLPHLSDKTEAVFGRLLLIPFRKPRATGDQDPTLPEKLIAEMPGILRWAADGARLLDAANGVWPDVPAATQVMAQYRDDTNPVGSFLRECCRPDAEWAHSLRDLNDAYNRLGYSGGRRTGTKQFGALLRAAYGDHAIKNVKFRAPDGHRSFTLRALVGWRLDDVNLPVGCAVPAQAAASSDREIIAVEPPPPPPDIE